MAPPGDFSASEILFFHIQQTDHNARVWLPSPLPQKVSSTKNMPWEPRLHYLLVSQPSVNLPLLTLVLGGFKAPAFLCPSLASTVVTCLGDPTAKSEPTNNLASQVLAPFISDEYFLSLKSYSGPPILRPPFSRSPDCLLPSGSLQPPQKSSTSTIQFYPPYPFLQLLLLWFIIIITPLIAP